MSGVMGAPWISDHKSKQNNLCEVIKNRCMFDDAIPSIFFSVTRFLSFVQVLS